MSEFIIKKATQDEMQILSDWALQEGWNPGTYDTGNYYLIDPEGFLIGWLNSTPIACISAVRYSDAFGFIGFYIVHPDFRGRGFGLQIWNAGMEHLKGCQSVGLDGVVEQQDNYRKSGFVFASSNQRLATQGTGTGTVHSGLVKLCEVPIQTVLDYDRDFFPAPRSVFLEAWIHQPQAVALGQLEGKTLQGMGIMRPCDPGYKVGPLFANNDTVAERIFVSLKNTVFETARMYLGPAPEIAWGRTYGITSFEVG
jgi:GNAT superfamily N-acetyltransferase